MSWRSGREALLVGIGLVCLGCGGDESATALGVGGEIPAAWMGDAGNGRPPAPPYLPADAGGTDDGRMPDAESPTAPPELCTNTEGQQVEACGTEPHATRSRSCDGTFWSAWSPCRDPEPCAPFEEQARSCGRNARGSSVRTCLGGTFGPWMACEDPDQCRDGERIARTCGLNQRGGLALYCEAGQWVTLQSCTEPDECVDEQAENEACGPNGHGARTRVCQAGRWSAWSACEDTDVCRDGARMAEPCGFNLRGAARRTCEAGQWSALGECWNLHECDDGTTRAVPSACGLNERGTSAQVCVQGAWRDGSCDDPDTCEDGSTSVDTCPTDGTLVQDFLCEEGSPVAVAECWLSECEGSEVDTRLCGINGNGKQTRKCKAQRWQAFGRCVDRDKCLLGSTREVVCGFNQRGKQAETCRASGGAAAYYADPEGCQDPDACRDGTTWSLPCGDAGENEIPVVCLEGQWAETGECAATE